MQNSPQYFEDIFTQIIDLKFEEEKIKDILLEINHQNIPLNALIGAVSVLKKRMKKIKVPFEVIDVCGTGGDKLNTLNISTAVCFVLAKLGVKVAKHGNKGVSSKSGSADIFSELNIAFDDTEEKVIKSLEEKNLSFLFAPYFHGALKNLAPIRKSLGVPTIFNFLGPLLNPTNTNIQLIGVSRRNVMTKMLETAKFFNPNTKIYVVHGFDGMDEITISDNSYLQILENGKIYDEEIINPEDFGIKKVELKEIAGKDPKYNALKLKELLDGKKSPYFDIVSLNAAFALKLVGKCPNINEALNLIK
ncbi:MAG: anthranilate phosphoribosyltransferase [Rickettsiales bacterium]|nr:anthranilate phosphoribosyltransferase [Rickettsiales bacterium]